MAVLDIVLEGDDRLRQKATRIRQVDNSVRKIAADMWETMTHAEGVGLAGPQVGVPRRIIVIQLPAGYDNEDDPEYHFQLINPEIVRGHGRKVGVEGCLSIPGLIGDVPRMTSLTVKAVDMDNRPVRIKANGHLAVIFQHEIDHLDGILYTDRVEDRSTIRLETAPDAAAADIAD